jgi:hypothetical protein
MVYSPSFCCRKNAQVVMIYFSREIDLCFGPKTSAKRHCQEAMPSFIHLRNSFKLFSPHPPVNRRKESTILRTANVSATEVSGAAGPYTGCLRTTLRENRFHVICYTPSTCLESNYLYLDLSVLLGLATGGTGRFGVQSVLTNQLDNG